MLTWPLSIWIQSISFLHKSLWVTTSQEANTAIKILNLNSIWSCRRIDILVWTNQQTKSFIKCHLVWILEPSVVTSLYIFSTRNYWFMNKISSVYLVKRINKNISSIWFGKNTSKSVQIFRPHIFPNFFSEVKLQLLSCRIKFHTRESKAEQKILTIKINNTTKVEQYTV